MTAGSEQQSILLLIIASRERHDFFDIADSGRRAPGHPVLSRALAITYSKLAVQPFPELVNVPSLLREGC